MKALIITLAFYSSTTFGSIISKKDTTDLDRAIANHDGELISVYEKSILQNFLQSEVSFSCPEIVIAVFDKSGNYLQATSSSRNRFFKNLQQGNLLANDCAYLIYTKFSIYLFDKRKKR